MSARRTTPASEAASRWSSWQRTSPIRQDRRAQTRCVHRPLSTSPLLAPPSISRLTDACTPQEYVYNLANAVRELDPHSEDQYLKELERLVRLHDPEHSNTVPAGL